MNTDPPTAEQILSDRLEMEKKFREADRQVSEDMRRIFYEFCDSIAAGMSTSLYDYVRFGGKLPMRLGTEAPLQHYAR